MKDKELEDEPNLPAGTLRPDWPSSYPLVDDPDEAKRREQLYEEMLKDPQHKVDTLIPGEMPEGYDPD